MIRLGQWRGADAATAEWPDRAARVAGVNRMARGGRTGAIRRLARDIGRCRRGVAAVEFALVVTPLMLLLFGYIATNTVFISWSAMQNSAQYAAQMVSTGQIKSISTGAITTSNNTATTSCSSTLTNTEAEYYACGGLPTWGSYTVTTTENCAVPSVAISISASGATAALGDVFHIFTGKTVQAQAVVMKQGSCP